MRLKGCAEWPMADDRCEIPKEGLVISMAMDLDWDWIAEEKISLCMLHSFRPFYRLDLGCDVPCALRADQLYILLDVILIGGLWSLVFFESLVCIVEDPSSLLRGIIRGE